MPRAPRIDIPGLIYHITGRGVKQLPIFHTEEDRQQFLRFLSRTRHEFPFRLHAYCLMTNHYHLLLQTLECSLSKTMQHFKTAFAKWFNRQYGHQGHVFQGRFHSIPVQEDGYLITVARYIHLNPVKAGIVSRPEDYAWSNYGKLVRGEADPLIEPAFLLGYFGNDISQQRPKYRLFVEDGIRRPELISLKSLYRMRFWGELAVQYQRAGLSHFPLSQ